MLRNRCLTLVTGCLLLALPAAAQDDCWCKREATRQATQCPAETQKAPETQKAQCPADQVQRQKPSSAEAAAHGAAPRDLPEVRTSEAARALSAGEVLADLPEKLAKQAKAIAVIPGVKKLALGWGGRWGKGLISMRDDNGFWIPPSFIEISGGSFGFQLGVQSTDLVLIFTDADAVNSLLRGKLTFNGNGSAAAGPYGREGQAGVDVLGSSGILAYSRAKGLFAGVSLDGSAITIDDTANHRVYGKYINGDEILMDRRVASNEVVAPFLDALDKHIPEATVKASP